VAQPTSAKCLENSVNSIVSPRKGGCESRRRKKNDSMIPSTSSMWHREKTRIARLNGDKIGGHLRRCWNPEGNYHLAAGERSLLAHSIVGREDRYAGFLERRISKIPCSRNSQCVGEEGVSPRSEREQALKIFYCR